MNMNNSFDVTNAKVVVDYNPYFYEDTQISIQIVEQIAFTHKKLTGTRVIGEFLKDKEFSKYARRSILKDILKCWDKEFKTQLNELKEELLKRNLPANRKKVKKMDHASIYVFMIICVLGILFQVKWLNFSKMNHFLSRPLYNNLLIGLIYISLIACLYMIIIKSYFEATRLVGDGSKKFLYQEFRTIKQNFTFHQKDLKTHLQKYINLNSYRQNFKLKVIYEKQYVITRLEKYHFFLQDKMVSYSKNYFRILVVSFVFKLIVLVLVVYLGISYMKL